MQSNVKFQSLPIADENSKIEVSLNADEQITLRLSTWTNDLGWCSQKTMTFDAALLDDLQRALVAARHKINRTRAAENQEINNAKVIAFPLAA